MEFFRTFTHNGRVLQLARYDDAAAKPVKAPAVNAPGAGKFEIGAVTLSAEKIAAGETFTLSAQVTGKNIAFLYTEVLFHDKELNQFYGPVAREYVPAPREKTTGGVVRPDWDDTLNLTIDLNPSLRALTDGVDSAFGFLIPAGYGASDSRLDGLYTPADGTTPRRARITFNSAGETADVLAYKEQGVVGAPRALTFKQDDQFAPFVQILTAPADENSAWQAVKGLSAPLVFRGQPFYCVTESLMPGEYLVGALAQDLDGNLTRKYAPLTIGG